MKIVVNDDEELVKQIRDKLAIDHHCPCKIDKNDDTICICKQFLESTELGLCECGLYKKVE